MTLTVQRPAKFIALIAFLRELKDTIRLFFRVYQSCSLMTLSGEEDGPQILVK